MHQPTVLPISRLAFVVTVSFFAYDVEAVTQQAKLVFFMFYSVHSLQSLSYLHVLDVMSYVICNVFLLHLLYVSLCQASVTDLIQSNMYARCYVTKKDTWGFLHYKTHRE